jgi:hypothetical protein
MLHQFQTYVAEILSGCNINRRRKTHADVIPTYVALPTCMHISKHEAGIRHEVGIRKHEAWTTACVAVACETCRRRVACETGFFFWKKGGIGGAGGPGVAGGRARASGHVLAAIVILFSFSPVLHGLSASRIASSVKGFTRTAPHKPRDSTPEKNMD